MARCYNNGDMKEKEERRKRILIIEDSRFFCGLLREHFEGRGFEVLVSHEGKEGLRVAAEENPDLVVLDLVLPDVPGEQVCKELKRFESPSVPVVMLTSKGSDADKVIGRVIGADAYISKPFEIEHLMKQIALLLKKAKESL